MRNTGVPFSGENRISQQALYKQTFSNVKLLSRTRWKSVGSIMLGTALRFRQLLRVDVPIPQALTGHSWP